MMRIVFRHHIILKYFIHHSKYGLWSPLGLTRIDKCNTTTRNENCQSIGFKLLEKIIHHLKYRLHSPQRLTQLLAKNCQSI